ncbi:ShlB/FhaC/HecB family hemolysin secretion/activation protein [Oxalicibacterium faecigallinarum]|nr:ShlB/FhaC/HecB family hemolysin secretion/activation protein [Oxalicibacterium faecigallinarum]
MQKNRIDRATTRYACALPLVLLMLHGSSLAADPPITPGSVLDTVMPPKPRLPSTPAQVVLPAQAAPSQHEPRAKRFRVNAFRFSGNTVYQERSLKRLVERFVDQELNLYDLNKAADTVTDFYHSRGYRLARAIVPAQKVENGIVNIQVIEGRMGKVTLSGNQRFSSPFILARTPLLTKGTLVTTDKLENTLLLLNDIPGLNTKVTLSPGTEFGATDAEIGLTEKLFSGYVGINNHGREETGQHKLEFGLNLLSPFGWGDQLSISGSSTDHQLVKYWKAGYSIPLNTIGTRLAFSASKVEYQVSGDLSALGINGDVNTKEMLVSHPLVRTRNHNEFLSLGVKRNELSQSALGFSIADSRINILTAGYQVNHIHEDAAITNLSLSLATNFKSVKTTEQQNAMYARLEMDVNHTAAFTPKWDLFLRANYVFSKERLPDTEKFSIGGPASVRGYRPSELRGDSGYLGTAELRRPFSIGNKMAVFRLTADTGQVVYKDIGRRDSGANLHSVGFGAIFYPTQGLVASIDVSKPVGSLPSNSDGRFTTVEAKNRIWMTISANF